MEDFGEVELPDEGRLVGVVEVGGDALEFVVLLRGGRFAGGTELALDRQHVGGRLLQFLEPLEIVIVRDERAFEVELGLFEDVEGEIGRGGEDVEVVPVFVAGSVGAVERELGPGQFVERIVERTGILQRTRENPQMAAEAIEGYFGLLRVNIDGESLRRVTLSNDNLFQPGAPLGKLCGGVADSTGSPRTNQPSHTVLTVYQF